MGTELRCTEKGCNYVASHEKSLVAKRMLGCHKRKVHGILGLSAQRMQNKKHHLVGSLNVEKSNSAKISSKTNPESPSEMNYKEMMLELLEEYPCCPRCGKNLREYFILNLGKIGHDIV